MEQHDVPLSGMEAQLAEWGTEALTLRFNPQGEAPGLPDVITPVSLTESLKDVRQRLDRVEELLSGVVRAKGRIERVRAAAKDSYDDAWAKGVAAARKKSNDRGGDFWGAKEIDAIGDTSAIGPKSDLRRAERLLSVVNESMSLVRESHRGLSDLRQDHLTILRSVSFETAIDR